ncbi:hypothetical protein BD779DRAFT_1588510 [Infundibulicybe gibba]|nr:hypothetical protein BD779DRAFT_1588510 [Infundibulicybe gibba]
MLAAATTTDNSTRDKLVSMIRSRAWLNDRPEQFPTDYSAASGQVTGMGGRSSPAQGAMFAFLALNLPERSIPVPDSGGDDEGSRGSNSKPNVRTIVGATIGAVAAIGLAGSCFLLWKRHQKCEAPTPASSLYSSSPYPDVSGSGDTYNRYPWDKDYINSWRSALAPSDSRTSGALRRQLESQLLQHSRSRSTSTPSEPFETNEPSTPEFPLDGGSASRGSGMRTPPSPPLNPTAPSSAIASTMPLPNSVPSQIDLTRWLRREMKTQLRETT